MSSAGSAPRTRRRRLWVTLGVVAAAGAVYGELSSPGDPAPSTAVTAPAGPPPQAGGQRICRVDTGTGVYYLLVHSGSGGVGACEDNPEAFGSNIDVMLAEPGMDRRCILPQTGDATVGVYSGRGKADLGEARGYCSAMGGTNS